MNRIDRLKSLIWLRTQYLKSNKALVYICVGTPIGDFALLSLIPKFHGSILLLSFALNFVYSMTSGSFVSMMIGEEKEKKNLRTLILSGVKMQEYIFSILFYPFLFSVFTCIFFPIFFGVSIPSWPIYLIIAISTSLIFILANLSIGLLAKSQMHASLFTFGIVMVATFLPMLTDFSNIKLVKYIIDWSFIGANTEYFIKLEHFKITDSSILSMLLWLIGLFILTKFAFAWNRKEHN